MTGMYEFDASGGIERMSTRGSGRFAESSGELRAKQDARDG